MTTKQDTIRQYLGDLIAVLDHVSQAVSRQAQDSNLARIGHATEVLDRTNRVLSRQLAALQIHAKTMGGAGLGAALKDALTSVTGALAGLYGTLRGETASRMLRDDYTALSFLSICTTMLHTTALTLKDSVTADLTRQHLHEFPPLIMAISELVPHAVVADLAADRILIEDPQAAEQAIAHLNESWRGASSHSQA